MKSIAHFFLYNNLVPIAFGVLFLGGAGALAATPAVQEAVLSSETIVASVDNTYLLSADFETYPFTLQIISVIDDTEKYFVEYTLNTVDLEDGVWRDVVKTKILEVWKTSLGARDLGLYVTAELTQLRDAEKARLLETQAIERGIGETQKVVTTMYSGLVGRLLSPTSEVLEGYTPVVVEEAETQSTEGNALVVLGASTNVPSTLDTIPPGVSIVGETLMKVPLNTAFADPGILVLNEDSYTVLYILDSVEVPTFDGLDTSRVWAYVLTYRVSDSAGNVSEVRREVVVDGETTPVTPPTIVTPEAENPTSTPSSTVSTTTP